MVVRIRVAWAPGEVVERRRGGLRLGGTYGEADAGHHEAARKERPGNGLPK
jgi:hypothetical protein